MSAPSATADRWQPTRREVVAAVAVLAALAVLAAFALWGMRPPRGGTPSAADRKPQVTAPVVVPQREEPYEEREGDD